MKVSKTRLFLNFLTAIILAIGIYEYRVELINVWKNGLNDWQPCRRPIAYSISNIDSSFGVNKANILADIQKAEKIWESAINKPLFEYEPDGSGELQINFIYDYRQKATDAMAKIGVALSNDRASYDSLKIKYDSLLASYNAEKSEISSLTASYNSAKATYEKNVSYWNSRGGAPRDEYSKLEQERINLNNMTVEINKHVSALNSLVDTIKQVEEVLNKQVNALNLKVKTYNSLGDSTGREFNEGEYVRNASGTKINIYQFKDENQLVRVLAHELGHAIGLEHVDDPKAIMYYMNEGVNEKLTSDDLLALRNRCGIK